MIDDSIESANHAGCEYDDLPIEKFRPKRRKGKGLITTYEAPQDLCGHLICSLHVTPVSQRQKLEAKKVFLK